MSKPLPQIGKYYLLIQGALAVILGLLAYVDPRLIRWLWPDQPALTDEYSAIMRVVGAVGIAVGITGLALWRSGDWEKTKPMAVFMTVFYILAAVALILSQLIGKSLGPVVWFYGLVSLLLAMGWLYLWRMEEGGIRLGL